MYKSIVFGANGYLGRHMVHFLKENGHDVIPSGTRSTSIDELNNYIEADITSTTIIGNIDFDVDYIFVFAGLTGTSQGFDTPEKFIKSNDVGLLNILNHHRESSSKARIVFPSTRLVYKGVKDKFLKENDEKDALTVYAQNKLSCESYLRMYASNFDINYTIFRICVPYGNIFCDDYSYGTIGFFLSRAKNNLNISLYGGGDLRRTFTHVEDICESIIQTIQKNKSINNTFNIGSTDNMSLLEVAKLVGNKYKVGIDFVEWPAMALKIESGDTLFDDNKMLSTSSYQYKHELKNWVDNI